ncbi:DUF4416 family protein [candidate division CSSED10-310 bacterium]|uniref:DUF4416 family protein n=1 Tax=candidate division CSSED10-310 bacterium TaxID=2855610 RepID=A0ABV6Z1X7_UNCC1
MRGNQVSPVNVIVGVLTAFPALIDDLLPHLEQHLGAVDYQTPPFPFTVTDYYHREMGSPLKRYFLSFEPLIYPDQIASIKLRTSSVEDIFRQNSSRLINLDPGYMDYHKVVLASYKSGGYKIYLQQGVYGDMTLFYSKGRFQPFSWSFPDFIQGTYNQTFLKIRSLYKQKLRSQKQI